jgi:hypothetical protein
MRRTLIGLAAAGLLLVTGCSDSDDESGSDNGDAADESGGDESGGDESGGGDASGFCADFQELDDQFSADPEAAADPNAVIEALEGLDPPEEIADDYATILEVSRQTADLDPEDPEAIEEAQALSEDAAEAQERVSTYLADECGIDPGGSEGSETPEG